MTYDSYWRNCSLAHLPDDALAELVVQLDAMTRCVDFLDDQVQMALLAVRLMHALHEVDRRVLQERLF